MRDILIVSIVIVAAILALRRPWIGAMLWAWLSLMNPHRYAFGFSYDAPLALVAALVTLLGLLFTQDKESPIKGAPVVLFALFTFFMTLSLLFGLGPREDYPQWEKVMKINLMILVTLALLRTKLHIFALAWVCTLSLGLLGAKGGVFTLLSGGGYRVWGPPGSFIADNNEFALALVMTIPLLRFLQMQLLSFWGRHLMTAMMALCAVAALGSHSRGGLLAIMAMTLVLWWRGRSKVMGGIVLVSLALAMLAFMPDTWTERMNSIENYADDRSALGRFSAWWVSWRVAFEYPLGVGFNLSRPELFAKFSPYPDLGTPAAHSIYFQVLGHHGFGGLFLFLMIWVSTWWSAGHLRHAAKDIPQARWCADLGGMCQVALVGYLVGGAFLSLSYFDFPYYVMALVVLTRVWLGRRAWETEPLSKARWFTLPGLGLAAAPASVASPASAATAATAASRAPQGRARA